MGPQSVPVRFSNVQRAFSKYKLQEINMFAIVVWLLQIPQISGTKQKMITNWFSLSNIIKRLRDKLIEKAQYSGFGVHYLVYRPSVVLHITIRVRSIRDSNTILILIWIDSVSVSTKLWLLNSLIYQIAKQLW